MTPFEGREVWRGGVNTWECDEMGHLNVRFYVARAMEGLVGLAGAIGLHGAFKERANATLLVKDHHIRFLREARAGAPLHMIAGVIDFDLCEARVLQLLIHSFTGDIAASFQTVVAHVTAQDGRPFPWSATSRRLARDLLMPVPASAAPRGLDLAPGAGLASLPQARRLGMIPIASGAVGMLDCDVFGRMRPEVFIGRVSDGIPALGAALRGGGASARPTGVGGAVLEYRVCYLAWPSAGDRFEVVSGLAAVGDKTQRFIHWMLDPVTGRPWATAEAVAIVLDLEARRIVPIDSETRARMREKLIPGLRL
jgi:acyl-CoA thioester hydrolase